jgi:hypothetical protein
MTYHWRDSSTGLFFQKRAIVKGRATIIYHPSEPISFSNEIKAKNYLLFLVGVFHPPKPYRDLLEKKSETFAKIVPLETQKTELLTGEAKASDINLVQYQIDDLRRKIIKLEDAILQWQIVHPGYFIVPNFMQNWFPIAEISETWELLKYEDGVYSVIEDDWRNYIIVQRKLNVLIDRFGLAIKHMYDYLEKRNKLDDFSFVVAVGPVVDDDYPNLQKYFYEPVPDDARVDLILKDMKIKRADFIRRKCQSTIVVAFRNLATAMHFKFSYTGEFSATILDLSSLQEVKET